MKHSPSDAHPDWHSWNAAAKRLGCSRLTIAALALRGCIHVRQHGDFLLFFAPDIETLARERAA